jgi:hypothetical protein
MRSFESMNQPFISSKSSFPLAAFIWAIVAAALMGPGIAVGNYHMILASLPALALAGGLWLFKPAGVQLELTETSLRLLEPPEEIPYCSIESMMLGNRPQDPKKPGLKPGPLMIMHCLGALQVPARISTSVTELYRFLLDKAGGTGSRDVNPRLGKHLAQEESTFGADKVWTFCARRHMGRRASTRRSRACCLLLIATGIIWICASPILFHSRKDQIPIWLGWGIILSVFSFLFWLMFKEQQRHPDSRLRGWEKASLIVSPSGIAIVQGDLEGRLRWDELREAQLDPGRVHFAINSKGLMRGGIRLIVAGADIRIADIYDRPMPVIYSVMHRFWKGD